MYTRCPHCNTTFRITTDALERAAGQVRCGRCTQVFDAKAALVEEELPVRTDAAETEGESRSTPAPRLDTGHADEAEGAAGTHRAEAGETGAAAGASDSGILLLAEDWRVDAEQAPRHRKAWAAAAVIAALVLAGQLVHFYRADLARDEVVGDYLQRAYAAVGLELVPAWDPSQYRIRDWVATAEPRDDGRSRLAIRAEIENRASQPMPQPHIYLALKDRFDAVVASRVFAPEEYLSLRLARRPLRAGATTVAELEVVDPGPDAYGFELDVCAPTTGGGVRCANDDVFR